MANTVVVVENTPAITVQVEANPAIVISSPTVYPAVVSTSTTGPTGPAGAVGADGADGADGSDGADGADGSGMPSGGTQHQIIEKLSSVDDDTTWSYTDTLMHRVTNAGGSTLSAGTPVYVSAYASGAINVLASDASTSSTMPATMVVLEDIAGSSSGIVASFGYVPGVDTSAFSVGDMLYVAIGGGFTATRPTGATTDVQPLAIVLERGVSGKIMVYGRTLLSLPNITQNKFFQGDSNGNPAESAYALPAALGSNKHVLMVGGGATLFAQVDHGNLEGNGDDDHTQYSLISTQVGAPSSTPGRVGEVNIDTSGPTVYVSTGTSSSGDWTDVSTGGSGISNIVEDTSPQLGGNLDVNGNDITSAANGDVKISPHGSGEAIIEAGSGGITIQTTSGNSDIDMTPHGIGDVNVGTMSIDGDQTVGANQDGHVLTYVNGDVKASLKAPKMLENEETGTTYTLVITDAAKVITQTNASAIVTTIPPNASVAFEVGTVVSFIQMGAGQITITAGAGVTLRNANGLKTASQYSMAACYKVGTDEWVVYGDTTS